MSAASLTNIESGRRQAGRRRREISLDELVVLARALDVPPILLLFPVGTAPETEIGPGAAVPTWHAVRWFIGEERLDGRSTDTDPAAVPMTIFRRHQALETEYVRSRWALAASVAMARNRGISPPADSEQPIGERAQDALIRLLDVRTEIRRAGLIAPPIRDGELAEQIEQMEAGRG
jgi:hypothetical protein